MLLIFVVFLIWLEILLTFSFIDLEACLHFIFLFEKVDHNALIIVRGTFVNHNAFIIVRLHLWITMHSS